MSALCSQGPSDVFGGLGTEGRVLWEGGAQLGLSRGLRALMIPAQGNGQPGQLEQ